jgi:hypothetical protein
MLRCTGMADNVTLERRTLPALVKSLAFHVGILVATESMSGYSSVRLNRLSKRGIPRYLHGNDVTTHRKTYWTSAIKLLSQRIGVMTHFSMFVTRPDALTNS